MNGVDRFARWVLLISGLLTLTMLRAAVSPSEAMRSFFGESLAGPVAEIVVRSWGALIACLVVGQLGQILQFPQRALDLSPFTHVPDFPARDIEPLPVVVLLTIAFLLIGGGLIGFRRRDIG